jgi:hypothetical protein
MMSFSYDFVIIANVLLAIEQFVPSLGMAWYPNRSGYASSVDGTETPTSRHCETITLNIVILLFFDVGFIAGAEETGAFPIYTSIIWATLSLACIATGLVLVDRAVKAVEIADMMATHPVGLHTSSDDLPEEQRTWIKNEGLPGWAVVTIGATSLGVMMSSESDFIFAVLVGYMLAPVAMILIMYHRMGVVSSHYHQIAGFVIWVVSTGLILLGLFE